MTNLKYICPRGLAECKRGSVVLSPQKTRSGDGWVRRPGRIKMFNEKDPNLIQVKKSNRYLRHQHARIVKALEKRDYKLAFAIYSSLMSRSRAFRVYWYTETIEDGYYKNPLREMEITLRKMERIQRLSKTNILVHRVYIPKPNGKKRPLGVPSKEGRVVTAGGNWLITAMLIPYGREDQYAFRPLTSCMDAGDEIFKRYKPGMRVFEFDLEKCGNRIPAWGVMNMMIEFGIPSELARYVFYINTLPPKIHISELDEDDVEMEAYKCEEDGKIEVMKKGLPQGLAGSPILSTTYLDMAYNEIGVNPVTYADDGVIVGGDGREFEKLVSDGKLEEMGIVLSKKEKNGKPVTREAEDQITFLGATGLFKFDCILIEGRYIPRAQVTKKMGHELIWKSYAGGNVGGNWKIDGESGVMKYQPILSWLNVQNALRGVRDVLFRGKTGIKGMEGRALKIGTLSSYAANSLLNNNVTRNRIGRRYTVRDKFNEKELIRTILYVQGFFGRVVMKRISTLPLGIQQEVREREVMKEYASRGVGPLTLIHSLPEAIGRIALTMDGKKLEGKI